METLTATTTVEEIRAGGDRALFPTEVLDGCRSALVLFAAAFLGRQDACWIEEAGITATCVDNDRQRLDEMLRVYPEDWTFVLGDVFDYLATSLHRYDLVTVDCPSNMFDRCSDLAEGWCRLARHTVVLGTAPGARLAAPDDWRVTRTIRRSTIANWTVLERL